MNKKKLLTLAMVISMVAILVVGGTIAYFTDTDTKTNTFTYGDVEIEINEIFENPELFPGEANAVTKEVRVENKGSEDAYMWIELWIPSELDTIGKASENDLHFNPFNTYTDGTNYYLCRMAVAKANGYTLVAETNEVSLGAGKGDKEGYNGYRLNIVNDTPKVTGEKTHALLARVFMDQAVTQCHEKDHAKNCLVLKDGKHYDGTWEIIIDAFGIQANGLANIDAAMAAYYAENN